MQIHYLDNSGFCIFLENTTLIIDYYNDKSDGDRTVDSGVITEEELKKNKKTYVLNTHKHADHFNTCVLDWKQKNEEIKYIFDSGIMHGISKREYDISFLSEGEEYKDDSIWVKAYGSTDIGISFMIKAEGYTIYHAGDLNFWHWEDEAGERFVKRAKTQFLNKLDAIIKEEYDIDIMFFPVDYRMGERGDLGSVMAKEALKPKVFIPMHFQKEFDRIEKYKKENEDKDTAVWAISARGDVLHLA